MEGNRVRKHRGIKWFRAKFVTNRVRARRGNSADEEAVMKESSKLIAKGWVSPDQPEPVTTDSQQDDDESFDVRVAPGPVPTAQRDAEDVSERDVPVEASEMDLLTGFFLDMGSCRCIDAEDFHC